MSESTSSKTPVIYEKKEDYSNVLSIPEGYLQREGISPADPTAITRDWVDEAWLGHRACVLHNVFSPSECAAMIAYSEGKSEVKPNDPIKECPEAEGLMVPAHSRTDYRNNLRVIAMAPDIAEMMYKRVLPFLDDPEHGVNQGKIVIDDTNATDYEEGGAGIKGTWEISYINPCFRICKYHPGGHFGPHYDSEYFRSYDCRSLKTFMIYLNDNYELGTTNFLENHKLFFDESLKRYRAPEETVRARLKARQGDVLMFDHLLLHEGDQVLGECKYIMRAEVMYQRPPPETEEEHKLQRGYTLMYEAKKLEASGEYEKAIEKYRAAFKLVPELQKAA